MDATDRIAALKAFVAQSPEDPFPRYGLALAYRTAGQTDEALAAFADLVAAHPGYVATYLMYGGTLADAGRTEDAAQIFRRGLDAASRAGDHHARSELGDALAALDES